MKTGWIRYAMAAGLAGAAALIATTATGAKVATAAEGSVRVAQYCAPSVENSETQRIFCRDDRG